MALEVNGQSISGISLDNKPIRLIYKDEINQKNLLFSDLAPIDANLMITDALGNKFSYNSESSEINFSYPYSYKFNVSYYNSIINPTFSIETFSEDEDISFEVSKIKDQSITITPTEGKISTVANYSSPIQITLTLKGDNKFNFGNINHTFEYDNNIFNFEFTQPNLLITQIKIQANTRDKEIDATVYDNNLWNVDAFYDQYFPFKKINSNTEYYNFNETGTIKKISDENWIDSNNNILTFLPFNTFNIIIETNLKDQGITLSNTDDCKLSILKNISPEDLDILIEDLGSDSIGLNDQQFSFEFNVMEKFGSEDFEQIKKYIQRLFDSKWILGLGNYISIELLAKEVNS